MSTLIWKRRIGWLFRSRPVRRDIILIYHSVSGGPLSLSEKKICEQMVWLKSNAHVVTLDELINTPNADILRIALSFDDGYRTLYETVHPILTMYGFPAIVYLNSGWLGEEQHIPSNPRLGHYPNEEFLTWSEVEFLTKHGWIGGAHGVDHLDLTKTSVEETKKQLVGCKAQIEEKLGVACDHFAYTWGRYNASVRVAVVAAGFKSAVAALHGPVTESSDYFALPRVDIRADYELRDFIDAVTGRWDFIGIKQRLMHV